MADAVERQLPGPQNATASDKSEPRKAEPGYTPSPDAKKLIDRVNERLNYGQRPASRWALERQAFEAVAFFAGTQWIEYSEQTRRFTKWNSPAWFPTPVDNQIAPRVLGMQARLVKSKPTGRVRPNTGDAKDREAARVADQMGGHIDDVVNEDELRDEASLIAALQGTVIFYDAFNPQGGRQMSIPRMSLDKSPAMQQYGTCPQCKSEMPSPLVGTPCPSCSATAQAAQANGSPIVPPVPTIVGATKPRMLPDGKPAMHVEQKPEIGPDGKPVVDVVREGEIESKAKMLFNFYWDPKAHTLKQARWCGEVSYSDLDWIDQNFPEMGKYVAVEEGADATSFYEASLTALIGPSIQGTAHYGGGQNFSHGAVLRCYQERPSKEYPKGIWAVVCNNILLYPIPKEDGALETELPIQDKDGNPTGDFNYTEFKYDVLPGRFAGRTPCDDMVPLQRKVNGIDAQILMNRKTLLNPWVLAPKGSGLQPGQVAMRPAATVLYNFVGVGQAPQVVKGEALPESIYKERENATGSMDQLAQDDKGSKSEMPAGVKSGIALNFLREQKDENVTPRLARWARCMADRKRKQLLLAQRHYREARAIKLMGPGKEWRIHYWQGSDLAGNTDVSIDPGTVVPRSVSVKTQLLFDAAEQQLVKFEEPAQRQKALELLGLQEFETEIGPDMRRAEKENAEMDEGKQVQINEEDNHEIHLMQHIPRIKDPSFDYLPELAKAAHKAHKALHMAKVIEAQKMAAKAQQANPGQGGGVEGGKQKPQAA